MPFLTNADAWLCICAARLAELAHGPTDFDELASVLYRDPVLGLLDPIAAAETFTRGQRAAA